MSESPSLYQNNAQQEQLALSSERKSLERPFEMLTLTLIVSAPSSSSFPQGRPRKNRIFDLVQKAKFASRSEEPLT